jgi:hypothetical protein
MSKFNELVESVLSEASKEKLYQKHKKDQKILKVYSDKNISSDGTPYDIIVGMGKKGHHLFSFKNAEMDDQYGYTPSWRLKDILYGSDFNPGGIDDELAIDSGQGWIVSGLRNILDKIRKDYPKGKLNGY